MKYLILLLVLTGCGQVHPIPTAQASNSTGSTVAIEQKVDQLSKEFREFYDTVKAERSAISANHACIARCRDIHGLWTDGESDSKREERSACFDKCEKDFPYPETIASGGC